MPVVAGRSGGAPETVTPESGVVVDGRDTNEVARAIAAQLPGLAAHAGPAAAAFDEVTFGDVDGTEDDVALLVLRRPPS